MSGSTTSQFFLTDENSWADWFRQIQDKAKAYSLGYVLTPTNPGQYPAIYPGLLEYPEDIDEESYLTAVPSASIAATQLEPVYEMTAVNRARLNNARFRNSNERIAIDKKQANYRRLRKFILSTIDDSNRSHLQTYIKDAEFTPVGELVELLRIHREQSNDSIRMNLIERLQQLKEKGFLVPNDQQLERLNEWSKLVVC